MIVDKDSHDLRSSLNTEQSGHGDKDGDDITKRPIRTRDQNRHVGKILGFATSSPSSVLATKNSSAVYQHQTLNTRQDCFCLIRIQYLYFHAIASLVFYERLLSAVIFRYYGLY